MPRLRVVLLALVLAFAASPAARAQDGDPGGTLLSGYSGPGGGEQAVLGSKLLPPRGSDSLQAGAGPPVSVPVAPVGGGGGDVGAADPAPSAMPGAPAASGGSATSGGRAASRGAGASGGGARSSSTGSSARSARPAGAAAASVPGLRPVSDARALAVVPAPAPTTGSAQAGPLLAASDLGALLGGLLVLGALGLGMAALARRPVASTLSSP